jgi:Tfp pilus assembly protein PilF
MNSNASPPEASYTLARRVGWCYDVAMHRTSASPWLYLCCVVLCACGDPAREPLNALIITLDTTRADAVGWLDGPAGITPNLDALAEESVVYAAARTTVPLTLPAHASMFTGLYPNRHTLRDNGLQILPASASTLAERASKAGYQTAAFVATIVLEGTYGLGQGFQTYEQPLRGQKEGIKGRSASEITQAVLRWLDERESEQPFLIWAHYFDPHSPRDPSERFLKQAGGDPYHGEIAAMDAAIGQLLDGLRKRGVDDRTLIVVVADHGEGLGEHGEKNHGAYCYATTMRVPFLIRHPDGFRRGDRSLEIVSVVDVYPTVLEALELGSPGDVDGLSLLHEVPEDRGVYFESYDGYLAYGWSPLVGWANRWGVYLHGSVSQYFDGPFGAGEGRVLEPGELAAMAPYRSAIEDVAKRPTLVPSGEAQLEPDQRDLLQSLGYAVIGSRREELPLPLDDTGLPDPHARKEELRLAMEASNLMSNGNCNAAIIGFQEVVARYPTNYFAMERLTECLVLVKRYREAIEPLKQLVASGPGWASANFNLGRALYHSGDQEPAMDQFHLAVLADPGHVPSLYYLCRLLKEANQHEEAQQYCDLLEKARSANAGLP